jgi:heme exporter protein B
MVLLQEKRLLCIQNVINKLTLFSSVQILIRKEIQLEWRNKYAFSGILLYVAGAVFVCFMSFNVKKGVVHPITWNALFWIIILFSAVNAVSKSFSGEREARNLYYYTLIDPVSLIISKMIYNTMLLLVLGALGFGFYTLVMGNPVQDNLLFVICLALAAIGFASALTLVSAIASKAGNNGTLMAVLSFPVLLPMLLLIIKISKNALDGLDRSVSFDELLVLAAINAIVVAISCILFPFLWRN